VQDLKQKLRNTPLYGKNLVADDFKGRRSTVFFRNLTDAEYRTSASTTRWDGCSRPNRSERFFYTGRGTREAGAVEFMRHDLFRFTPIALLVILLVLWLSFWTVRGVVLRWCRWVGARLDARRPRARRQALTLGTSAAAAPPRRRARTRST